MNSATSLGFARVGALLVAVSAFAGCATGSVGDAPLPRSDESASTRADAVDDDVPSGGEVADDAVETTEAPGDLMSGEPPPPENEEYGLFSCGRYRVWFRGYHYYWRADAWLFASAYNAARRGCVNGDYICDYAGYECL